MKTFIHKYIPSWYEIALKIHLNKTFGFVQKIGVNFHVQIVGTSVAIGGYKRLKI